MEKKYSVHVDGVEKEYTQVQLDTLFSNTSGWHEVDWKEVYIDEGRVLRGIVKDHNGGRITAYPYRKSKDVGWDNVSGCPLSVFVNCCMLY